MTEEVYDPDADIETIYKQFRAKGYTIVAETEPPQGVPLIGCTRKMYAAVFYMGGGSWKWNMDGRPEIDCELEDFIAWAIDPNESRQPA